MTSGSTVSANVSGQTPGVEYWYKVQAYRTVNGTKVTGGMTGPVNEMTYLKPLTGLQGAFVGSTGIQLSWNKVAGAHGYLVWMYDASTEQFVTIDSCTDNQILLTGNLVPNGYYAFMVTGYHNMPGGTDIYRSGTNGFVHAVFGQTAFEFVEIAES